MLVYASQFNSLETDKQSVIDKCKRLKSLGFARAKEVVEGEEEIRRIEKLEKENEEKKDLIEAIKYFRDKYPIYKFITEESVERICEKYGLVYGGISNYIGTVPDKNLKHMENFKISDADTCYSITESRMYSSPKTQYANEDGYEREKRNYFDIELSKRISSSYYKSFNKCPLEIAAPMQDFDMQGKTVEKHKIVKAPVPDPIVLQPVIFKNKKHYLIVTAWGAEASDEAVVNEKMN